MDRRESIAALAGLMAAPSLSKASSLFDIEPKADAYLMAHFMENDQKLYYAISHNVRDWTALNKRKPVFDPKVNLRDPFIGRAKGQFHLVHTKGWDHPVIHYYSSTNLLDWQGTEIKVVSDDKKRAWAPEWIYDEATDLFYVFWASEYKGHNAIHYVTTKDWTDITPERSSLYFDLGIDNIDLTIFKAKGKFYGFQKAGSLGDDFSVSYMTSLTLDPKSPNFGFGKTGKGVELVNDTVKPTEGPEIIKLNGQQKWYLYADPFHNDFIAWETTDFVNYKRIPVSVPRGAKHCSMIGITKAELDMLLKKYPV